LTFKLNYFSIKSLNKSIKHVRSLIKFLNLINSSNCCQVWILTSIFFLHLFFSKHFNSAILLVFWSFSTRMLISFCPENIFFNFLIIFYSSIKNIFFHKIILENPKLDYEKVSSSSGLGNKIVVWNNSFRCELKDERKRRSLNNIVLRFI